MEHAVNLHIEKLPEGVYLATSDDVPGLVAQGRTIAETVEIACGSFELAEEHLAEVRRRRGDTNVKLLTLEEFDARLSRFGL